MQSPSQLGQDRFGSILRQMTPLVLLGNIFLSLGNNRDSFNMVTPAMQLASKIPDVNIQLWASAVLKGKTSGTYSWFVSRW